MLEEQEAILKNVLTRSEDEAIRSARLIPTATLEIPATDEVRPMQDLINEAIGNRPDLGQAHLQVENNLIGLQGAKNATLPEVDLVGIAQNNGLAGPTTGFLSEPQPALRRRLWQCARSGAGARLSHLRHRRASDPADPQPHRRSRSGARRVTIPSKSQIRVAQLQNQAKLEVEDALIAIRRARASYDAAVQARKFQQESLEAEQAKFEVGASTAFFVIQYESLLAQAKSTEVAAKSSYVKARAALQRATGSIVGDNNISFDNAIKGKM